MSSLEPKAQAAQTRRSFLVGLGLVASALACDDSPLDRRRRIPRIGIQLYTVRAEAARDLRGTLQRLSEIGYREVELAGSVALATSDVRRMLDDLGLTAPSAHVPLTAFDDPRTFDDARVLGHEWLTVPSPPSPPPSTADDWARLAAALDAAAEKAKQSGFRLAYHNHAGELARVGDTTGLEVLLARTDPSLVSFEMDIHWVVAGGGDPRDLLVRHPARFTMLHVKDSSAAPTRAIVDVGAGTTDFAAIFASSSNIRSYFVEHDDPADPFATAANSHRFLAGLTF